jgi:hypothetical protein
MGSLSMMTTLLGCFDLHSRVVYIFEKIPFHYGDTVPRKSANQTGSGQNPKQRATAPTIHVVTTSRIAIIKETGSPAIVRPFLGAAGNKKAPTDALRLVGAISLSAVLGGPHPHQRLLNNRGDEQCVKRCFAPVSFR